MHQGVETEFKLRATADLAVAAIDALVREAGFVPRAADTRRHVDVYLDDAHGSLRQAGIGLRLRADGDTRELTCKTRGQRNGSLFVRDEWVAPWQPGTAPRVAADLPPLLRDAVEPFVLDRPLVEVLQLVTHRERRVLQCDHHDLCELAIDRVQATAAGRSASFLEVELEVLDDLPGCERLAEQLARDLPLQAADDDKPGHAAALLGLQRAPGGAPTLRWSMPVGAAVAAIVRPHLLALQHAEAGVRREDLDVHLHAMRVATRRLRAILRSFGDLWPRAERKWLLEHLAETGRRLGALRDLDVVLVDLPPAIEQLPASLRRASPAVLDWIGRCRRSTRAGVLGWLASAARLADQRRLCDAISALPPAAAAAEPLRDALPRRLQQATRKVRKLARSMPAELPFAPLHRLRIACKRLRYLAEEFGALPGHAFAGSLAKVVRLQESLGAVCDHELAARRLCEWIPSAAAAIGDSLQVASLLGGLAARAASAAARARARARRDLARVDRKRVYRRLLAAVGTDASLA